jgi:hypothetical protein
VVHSHILHYAPLPHAIEFGGDGTVHGCKVIAHAYVVKVIESLQQRFPDLKLFNAAKLFSPVFFNRLDTSSSKCSFMASEFH